jgi:hypothetical protein
MVLSGGIVTDSTETLLIDKRRNKKKEGEQN